MSPILNAVSIKGCIPCRICYVTSLTYFKPVKLKLESKKTAYIHTCKPPSTPSLTNQSLQSKMAVYINTHTHKPLLYASPNIYLQTSYIVVLTPPARLTSASFPSSNSQISMLPVFTAAVRRVSSYSSKVKPRQKLLFSNRQFKSFYKSMFEITKRD